MQNNIFQPSRFGKLISRSLNYNIKGILQSILIYAGLPLLFLLGNISLSSFDIDIDIRYAFFTMLLFAAFIFSPFIYFYSYNHPKKGLTDVMLPASALEKYILMQLTCTVFAPLIVFVLYGGMDFLISLLFPQYFKVNVIQILFSSELNSEFIFLLFLTVQAMIFCNLIFVKRKLLKTIGSFIAVNLLLGFLIISIVTILDRSGALDPLTPLTVETIERYHFAFSLDDHPFVIGIQLFRFFMEIITPIGFIVASYFIMKTKKY